MTDAQVVAHAATLGASVFPPDMVQRLNDIAAALRQLDMISAYADRVARGHRL